MNAIKRLNPIKRLLLAALFTAIPSLCSAQMWIDGDPVAKYFYTNNGVATAALRTCAAALEGTFAYDTTTNGLTVCNGSAWVAASLATPVTVANGGTGLSSGTSGGIPYYSATTTMASSGALTVNTFVKGGGAGASPTSAATTETSGHLGASGTAPVVSACGTTPSTVTGNDQYGRLTTGSGGTVQSCTLTFAAAYTAAPSCVVNDETSILLVRATATTTTLVLDSAVAGTLESEALTYVCRGL